MMKGKIHAIAECQVCGKTWEKHTTALKQGAGHAAKTGHRVTGEAAYAYEWGSAPTTEGQP